MLMSAVIDSVDGSMARQRHKTSQWGAFLDSTLDRVSDLFYLIGFWVIFYQSTNSIVATLGIFIAILLTFLISYSKARAEALGYSCPVGLMERSARVTALLIWTLALVMLPAHHMIILWLGLLLYNTLTLTTAIQRGVYTMRQMANQPSNGFNCSKSQHI